MNHGLLSPIGRFTTLFLLVISSVFSQEPVNNERYVPEIEVARMLDEQEQLELELSQSAESTISFGSNVNYIDERAIIQVTSIGSNGSNIEMPNGSTWEVRWGDRRVVQNWKPRQQIYLMPGSSWSSYRYTAVNMIRQEQAQVLMASYAWYNSPHTKYITDIDKITGHVQLNDGSSWDVSRFHQKYVALWEIGDVVMIGVNNGFLSFSNPNILINLSHGKMYIACSPVN